ncbi:proton-transporting V-type ATPase complex assembly regulator TMEM9-like isoform X2 [Ciona intestinalis]
MYCGVLLFVLLSFQFLEDTSAQYEDIRCKCTCLAYHKYNIPAKIYTKNVLHEYCDCLRVVLPNLNGSALTDVDIEPYCLRCGCKYEVRSTKTMQVVVYMFLVLLGVLLIYMVVMVIADPIINHVNRKNRAAGLLDEETEMESIVSARDSDRPRSSSGRGSGQSQPVLQRVNQMQTKWKKQLQEQKSNVYDRHEMLQ